MYLNGGLTSISPDSDPSRISTKIPLSQPIFAPVKKGSLFPGYHVVLQGGSSSFFVPPAFERVQLYPSLARLHADCGFTDDCSPQYVPEDRVFIHSQTAFASTDCNDNQYRHTGLSKFNCQPYDGIPNMRWWA